MFLHFNLSFNARISMKFTPGQRGLPFRRYTLPEAVKTNIMSGMHQLAHTGTH